MLKTTFVVLATFALIHGLEASASSSSDGGDKVHVRKRRNPGVAAKMKGKIVGAAKKKKDMTSLLFPGVTPEEYWGKEAVCQS